MRPAPVRPDAISSSHSPSSLLPRPLFCFFFCLSLCSCSCSSHALSAQLGAAAGTSDDGGAALVGSKCGSAEEEACPTPRAALENEVDGDLSLLQTVSSASRAAKSIDAELLQGLFNATFDERFGGSSMTPPNMKDVETAFKQLDKGEGTILRANIGGVRVKGYNEGFPPYSEHFQSIQRAQNAPVFYLSGSGESSDMAQVFVLDLRSKSGGDVLGSNVNGRSRGPPSQDALLGILPVDGDYWHAGGMSAYENILVVGAEPGCGTTDRLLGRCKSASHVYFYDISTPESPKKLPLVLTRRTATAGTTSLIRKSDGRFLLAVGGGGAKELDFYVSSTTDLTNPSTRFQLITSWSSDTLTVASGVDEEYGEYQTLNFVRQTDGAVYIIGLYRSLNGLGSDYADLFRVYSPTPSTLALRKMDSIQLNCQPDTCNFQAGAGAYVASEDTLLLYASNWEPNWEDKSIYINEFRPGSGGTSSQTKLCDTDTGGSCSFFGCDSSRGPTTCSNDKCVCKPGFCVVAGRCMPHAR